MGSILGAIGTALGGPLGGLAGTVIGGMFHGGGGGGGGAPQPQQSPIPGVNPYALSAAISALPAQQAATSALQQESGMINNMANQYTGLYGSIPVTADINQGLSTLFNPAGNVPATNYQIGQLQTNASSQADQMRTALANRGITGPLAESLVNQAVTEPEMTGEANIRAQAMNESTGMQEAGLNWLSRLIPNAGTIIGGEAGLGQQFLNQAQAAAAPFYQAMAAQGYQAGQAPPGSVYGAQAGAGAGGLPQPPLPPVSYQSAQDASGGQAGFREGGAMPGYSVSPVDTLPPPTFDWGGGGGLGQSM